MKAVLFTILASAVFGQPLLGGFTSQDTCINLDPLGSPANLFINWEKGLLNFFGDSQGKKVELAYLATQVVAGLNIRAFFRLINNGDVTWIGIQVFRNLQNTVFFTKTIQTDVLDDLFTLFKMQSIPEEQLKALNCGNLFDLIAGAFNYQKPANDNKGQEKPKMEAKQDKNDATEIAKREAESYLIRIKTNGGQEAGWQNKDAKRPEEKSQNNNAATQGQDENNVVLFKEQPSIRREEKNQDKHDFSFNKNNSKKNQSNRKWESFKSFSLKKHYSGLSKASIKDFTFSDSEVTEKSKHKAHSKKNKHHHTDHKHKHKKSSQNSAEYSN